MLEAAASACVHSCIAEPKQKTNPVFGTSGLGTTHGLDHS
jgi:hypothetical protein